MPSLTVEVPAKQFRLWSARARRERTTVGALVERALRGLSLDARPRRKNDFQGGGMTLAQSRKQRKQLEREIGAEHKRANLEKLAAIDGEGTAIGV